MKTNLYLSFGSLASRQRALTGLTSATTSSKEAFTIMELMAVIAIILLLAGIVVPATMQMANSHAITNGGQLVEDQLALARQIAGSRNRKVEVRFYKEKDGIGTGEHYRKLQTYLYDEKEVNPMPLSPAVTLPTGVIIAAESTAEHGSSTLIDQAPDHATDNTYQAFCFRGNGSTDLDLIGPGHSNANTWYLTIHLATDPTTNGVPKNYHVVQLDPLTGRTKTFRP